MTRERRARAPLWAWLVGREPERGTIAIAGASGAILGIIALAGDAKAYWADIALFAVAFDLAAGLVSNLSRSTRTFWLAQKLHLRRAYVLVHLLAYPLAIWALVPSVELGVLLSAVLAAKIFAFVKGDLGRSSQ
ncbi:MAG: hypothetical protein RLZZ460_512 [Chloroflexota bacterium]